MATQYLITEYGQDDYGLWITYDITNEASGTSVRGTLNEIKNELAEALATDPAKPTGKKMTHYIFNGHTYTVENLTSSRWQMTVWDDKDGDSYGITDPSLIIKVLTQGRRV